MAIHGRTRLLTFSVSALLALGVLGAGVAVAQDPGGEDSPGDSTERHPHAGARILKGLLHSIVENSGIDGEVFRQGFQDGKSINDILEEQGVESAAVQEAVLADLQAKLDELVANSTLSQPEADRIYAAAEQHLPALMERVPDPDGGHRRPGVRLFHGIKHLLSAAAESLSLETSALAERLRAGETVADVAADQGVPVDEVTAAMLADANAKLDAAVANGRIDEPRAGEIRANLEARIERFVTEGRGRGE